MASAPKDNHYKTLGVTQKATQQQIKQAYRQLVKQFHPDSQNDEACHETMTIINEAYEVLSDPDRRDRYDQQIDFESKHTREERSVQAQQKYKQQREHFEQEENYRKKWLKEIYTPVNQWANLIIQPLKKQIDYLAADPFDDELMEQFQKYLEQCHQYLRLAQTKIDQQPTPSGINGVVNNLRYCLDEISDALDELENFTLNYNDQALHTGQELFRIAAESRKKAAIHATQAMKYK